MGNSNGDGDKMRKGRGLIYSLGAKKEEGKSEWIRTVFFVLYERRRKKRGNRGGGVRDLCVKSASDLLGEKVEIIHA